MQCKHINNVGQQCKAPALKADEFCYFHTQKADIVRKRDKARKNGGLNRHRGEIKLDNTIQIDNMADIKALLSLTLNELRANKINANNARCIGYLASILSIIIEKGDFEERLKAIEERLDDSGS